jgi:DNA-binding GntR family transcriptional regulator
MTTRAVLLQPRVCSVNVDADGRPIQYSETAFCANRVQLVLDNERQ